MQEVEDLAMKIYEELDIIRIISNLSGYFIKNNTDNLTENDFYKFEMLFQDFCKRCDKISQLTEQMECKTRYVLK